MKHRLHGLDQYLDHFFLTNPGKLFADDSKLLSKISGDEAAIKFQEDIDKMVELTSIWKMSFNCSKCKVMHIRHNNPSYDYTMIDYRDGKVYNLEIVQEERDLGVIVSSDLKWKRQ